MILDVLKISDLPALLLATKGFLEGFPIFLSTLYVVRLVWLYIRPSASLQLQCLSSWDLSWTQKEEQLFDITCFGYHITFSPPIMLLSFCFIFLLAAFFLLNSLDTFCMCKSARIHHWDSVSPEKWFWCIQNSTYLCEAFTCPAPYPGSLCCAAGILQ